jgi:hypothetical protein
MTPEEEAHFIALWQEGLTAAAIAQRLGIPPGTVRSRVYTLQQQGKIPPRLKGGKRVRTHTPAPTREAPAEAALPTREAPAELVAVPLETIERMQDLEARVAALEARALQTPAPPAGTRTHPREHIKQWTVRLSQALIEAVKAQAATHGKEPSHLVEELLWRALAGMDASPPGTDGLPDAKI